MKKLFFTIIIPYIFSNSLLAETTINITNGEWEPFLSEYSYQYGLASHIVSEAFRLEGIKVKWGFYPWKRSYENAKKGEKWDAAAVWWPSEQAKQKFLISVPVVKTSFVFFHLKKLKFDWHSVDELKNFTIGFTRGYDYGKELMKAMLKGEITVDIVTTDEQNFKKILGGRADIFPNDKIVGYAQLKNTFSPKQVKLFTHHPKEFERTTLHLLISKKSKHSQLFLEKFNSGMNKLKKN